jgi:hypothetical protein
MIYYKTKREREEGGGKGTTRGRGGQCNGGDERFEGEEGA